MMSMSAFLFLLHESFLLIPPGQYACIRAPSLYTWCLEGHEASNLPHIPMKGIRLMFSMKSIRDILNGRLMRAN